MRASFNPLSVAEPLEPSTEMEEPSSAASSSLSPPTRVAIVFIAAAQDVPSLLLASAVS